MCEELPLHQALRSVNATNITGAARPGPVRRFSAAIHTCMIRYASELRSCVPAASMPQPPRLS
jgi:hypothetical protein